MAEAYPAGGYQGGGAGVEKPNNNLVWSIIAIFFCTILGIVALIFALQVDNKWQAGDYAGATDAAKKAKTFSMISIIGGVLIYVGTIIAIVAIAALGTSVTVTTFR